MAYEEIRDGLIKLLDQLEHVQDKKDLLMIYTALYISLKFVVKGDVQLMVDFTNMLVQYSKDVLDRHNTEIN